MFLNHFTKICLYPDSKNVFYINVLICIHPKPLRSPSDYAPETAQISAILFNARANVTLLKATQKQLSTALRTHTKNKSNSKTGKALFGGGGETGQHGIQMALSA